MKGLVVLAIAVVVGICGYAVYFRTATAPTTAMLAQSDPEMQWLRREFRLSDAQFERIRQMHRDYTPVCDKMCERIAKANARLDEMIAKSKTMTAETEAALHECAQVQEDCHRAMLGHVYAVSAEMSPEDGARYLQMMKLRIIAAGLKSSTVVSESPR